MPAAGQGCLALEIRAPTTRTAAVGALPGMTARHDDTDCDCLMEERDVVRLLGATCNTPIGVHATAGRGGSLTLTAFVGLPDGSRWIRDELELPHSPMRPG